MDRAKKRREKQTCELQALERVKTSQKSIHENERELGIRPGLLHTWKARLKGDGAPTRKGRVDSPALDTAAGPVYLAGLLDGSVKSHAEIG